MDSRTTFLQESTSASAEECKLYSVRFKNLTPHKKREGRSSLFLWCRDPIPTQRSLQRSTKMQKLLVVFILFLLLSSPEEVSAATTDPPNDSCIVRDTICDSSFVCQTERSRSDNVQQQSEEESFRKKKLITSILAFPIPFGFIGLHRIYLGTAPWVPIAYLCTGGGGLGLLPILDFIFIVTADEEEFKEYENNPNFFMFVE